MSFKSIRGGSGLGDSIYLHSVVKHLLLKGEQIRVHTNYPDLYKYTDKENLSIFPHSKENIDLVCHYTSRKSVKGTNQFQDCCINVGIKEEIDLKIQWNVESNRFIDSAKRKGRKIAVVLSYREPMNRKDGFGLELLPDFDKYSSLVLEIAKEYTTILVGSGHQIQKLDGINIDSTNFTSIEDLINIVANSDIVVGYCSFIIPLAESFGKDGMYLWSKKGLLSSTNFIKTITPDKVLTKQNSKFIIDSDFKNGKI